jgi:hypothetical protein
MEEDIVKQNSGRVVINNIILYIVIYSWYYCFVVIAYYIQLFSNMIKS